MLERMWRNGNPLALLVGMQIGAATLENSVEFGELFIDFGYEPFVRYVICKYLFHSVGCLLVLLVVSFEREHLIQCWLEKHHQFQNRINGRNQNCGP